MESTFPTALSISLVVNVILGIVFSAMYVFVYPGMTSTDENPKIEEEARLTSKLPENNGFCVSCDYLGQNLVATNTLYTEVVTVNCGDEHRLCCYNDTGLQRFIFSAANIRNTDELSEDKASLKDLLMTWRNRENAAHLYLNPSKPLSNDNYARWQATDPLESAFISSNISLARDSNTIQVSAKGKYYIYSSIKILEGYTAESENFNIILGRKRKSSPNSPLEKLQRKQFKNFKRDQHKFVLFQGIFDLEAEYEVGVDVHNNSKNLIAVSSSLSNYFGIYKVE